MFKKISVVVLLFVFCSAHKVHSQNFHWSNLPNSPFYPNGRMEDIYFLDVNTGWSVLFSGKVFKTTNGGANWDNIYTSSTGSLRSIGFFDNQIGLLGTLHEDSTFALFRTTDGGTNFTALSNLPNPRIRGVCGINIFNQNIAYACGRWDSPARIIKTTDKGNSWSSFVIDTSLARSLVDCYFWSPDSGVAVGGSNPASSDCNSVILKTMDGGNSWQQVYRSSRRGEYCWKICFVKRNLMYASIQGASVYYLKSTDGGNNWEDNMFRSYIQQGIGFVNENTGWIGGWTGTTYETTDAGSSWHPAGWGRNVNRFRFINDTIAYAVGDRVYKYSKNTLGINLISTNIPSSFFLSQNYPNPFNPATHLEFGITNFEFVTLRVYDVFGNEIKTLVNENERAGHYTVTFDGSNLSSGIYFYKLTAGNYTDTKRMILLK